MKKIILLYIFAGFFNHIIAQDLIYIPFEKRIDQYSFEYSDFKIHLYGDQFLIASGDYSNINDAIHLDSNPWSDEYVYSIIYVDQKDKAKYICNLSNQSTICLETDSFLIIKHLPEESFPAKNDASVRITKNTAKLAKRTSESYQSFDKSNPDPFVESLINEIDIDGIQANIQHLEEYVTRFYNKPQAFQSEQWIKEQFEALGLEAQIHTFPQPGSSGNVIAIQTGTLYPDEYVVCGAHYDTYNNNQDFEHAPGADDNASGVASIIEAARILSQYEMDRSIIYCAWAAEEIGLVGSQYYAEDAAADQMNILGYFNLDMTGYLDPTQEFHFVLHYSHNSELLRDFYMNIATTYYPGIPIEMSFSSWGSDYASFANNGFMGVSQNEDWSHANPHYHSPTDLIGPSVNNFEQVETYAGLNLASVVSLANSLMVIPFPPDNLTGLKGDQSAFLSWDALEGDIQHYRLYRDDQLIANVDPTENSYEDMGLENETTYNYYITAYYEGDIESSPSNDIDLTPLPPISYPFFTDFEDTKAFYWDYSEGWGLATNASNSPSHSLTDTPEGFYDSNKLSHCTLDPISLNGSTENSFMEFYVMYLLNEAGEGDYVYLEIQEENEEEWTLLDTFSGIQTQWTQMQYDLSEYHNQVVKIRFKMTSDESEENFGFFMDDFRIDFHTNTSGLSYKNISIFPNPASDILNIKMPVIFTPILIYNGVGQLVINQELNSLENQLDISMLDSGVYYIYIKNEKQDPSIFKLIKN